MSHTKTPDELRHYHRQKRAEKSAEAQKNHATALGQRLLALPEVKQAQNVAAYIAIRGEISLADVIEQLSEAGKKIYLPVLRGDAMHFSPWDPSQPLQKKGFGLLEPDALESHWIAAKDLDLVLAPLVVYDKHCNRIGQGGGYYDRTFAFRHNVDSTTPYLLGVAHDDQQESHFTVENWDVPLDMVATEKALYIR